MSTRQVIGLVMGVTGVVISFGHIILMVFTNLLKRYHGMEMVVAVGFVLGIAGLLLLASERRQ